MSYRVSQNITIGSQVPKIEIRNQNILYTTQKYLRGSIKKNIHEVSEKVTIKIDLLKKKNQKPK